MRFKKKQKSVCKRNSYAQKELLKIILFVMKNNSKNCDKLKFIFNLINYYFEYLLSITKNNHTIKNSCVLTGYSNFVFKTLKISRFALKKLIKLGYIFGCNISSW